MRNITSVLVALSLALHAGSARAEHQLPDLNAGMSLSDVLAKWGEPTEKIERETKRLMVWVYPAGKVVFSQGRVVVFPSRQPEKLVVINTQAAKAPSYVAPQPPTDSLSHDVRDTRDIIGEVLREVPSDDEKGISSRVGSVAGAPGMVRPQPMGPPPGIESPSDEP